MYCFPTRHRLQPAHALADDHMYAALPDTQHRGVRASFGRSSGPDHPDMTPGGAEPGGA